MEEQVKEFKGYIMDDGVLLCDGDNLYVEDKETGRMIEPKSVNVSISHDSLREIIERYMLTKELDGIRGFVMDDGILVCDSDALYIKDKETGKNIELEKVDILIENEYMDYLVEECCLLEELDIFDI